MKVWSLRAAPPAWPVTLPLTVLGLETFLHLAEPSAEFTDRRLNTNSPPTPGGKGRSGNAGSSSGIHGGGFSLYFVLSVFWRRICSQAYMTKVIYRANGTGRGFITAMLAPVDCRQKPRFGVRQTLWVLTLAFGTLALMRLLLAH